MDWSDEDEKRLLEFYHSNLTLSEIADRLSVGKTSLRNKIVELSLSREKQYKWKSISGERILEWERQGISYQDMAKRLQMSTGTLCAVRKRLGIYNPPQSVLASAVQGQRTRADNKKRGYSSQTGRKRNVLDRYYEDVVMFIKAGVKREEIAEKYRVCVGTVSNFMALHGLKYSIRKKLAGKDERILKLYRQGLSHRKIAQKLQCSQATMEHRLKKLGVSRPLRDVRIDSRLAQKEKVIKNLYMKGCSFKEIAQKVGAHPASVGAKIRRLGWQRPVNSTYTTKLSGQEERLWQMYLDGKKRQEIARALSVSVGTVFYHLKQIKQKRGVYG